MTTGFMDHVRKGYKSRTTLQCRPMEDFFDCLVARNCKVLGMGCSSNLSNSKKSISEIFQLTIPKHLFGLFNVCYLLFLYKN